jgi:hypothetical protein
MIAFGFGRAASVDAGMPASFRHRPRASWRGTQRVILAVCRNLSKLASDDCGILLHARRSQRQSPIQRMLQL